MKNILSVILLLLISLCSNAQTIPGNYTVTGYYFHPTGPVVINRLKSVTQVSSNTYQAELGGLGSQNYKFQFSIDINNNLINWIPIGVTPPLPASGFMTIDNPGNFTFPVNPGPGTSPWLHSIYNNKYDPATGIIHMHYGYGVGSVDQNGYTRQFYETWRILQPPKIYSVSPMTGTWNTIITIRGKNFTSTDPTKDIRIGYWSGSEYIRNSVDTAWVVSDSVIKARVGFVYDGSVYVSSPDGIDSLNGFTTTESPITSPQWNYISDTSFGRVNGPTINLAIDRSNTVHAFYSELIPPRGPLLKKQIGNSWPEVMPAYGGSMSHHQILIDTSNSFIVSSVVFSTSPNNFKIQLRKLISGIWTDLSMPHANSKSYVMALDKDNKLYVAYVDSINVLNVYRQTNTGWQQYPGIDTTSSYYNIDMAFDKKSNIPYIVFADKNNGITVKKFTGSNWVEVGTSGSIDNQNYTNEPSIRIDTTGNPVVAFIDGNGFERLSVYRYQAGVWSPLGIKISDGRVFTPIIRISKSNRIYVSYSDRGYNANCTVLEYKENQQKWDTVGRRGAIPCVWNTTNSFVLDSSDNLLMGFADRNNSYKGAVMKLNKSCYSNVNAWTGAINNDWNNPGNWGCGSVPLSTTDVVINTGAVVVVSTNTTINSLTLQPGVSFTVTTGTILTILH